MFGVRMLAIVGVVAACAAICSADDCESPCPTGMSGPIRVFRLIGVEDTPELIAWRVAQPCAGEPVS